MEKKRIDLAARYAALGTNEEDKVVEAEGRTTCKPMKDISNRGEGQRKDTQYSDKMKKVLVMVTGKRVAVKVNKVGCEGRVRGKKEKTEEVQRSTQKGRREQGITDKGESSNSKEKEVVKGDDKAIDRVREVKELDRITGVSNGPRSSQLMVIDEPKVNRTIIEERSTKDGNLVGSTRKPLDLEEDGTDLGCRIDGTQMQAQMLRSSEAELEDGGQMRCRERSPRRRYA